MSGYLKVGDIKGESTDEGHKDWINLLSVSNNITRPMGAGASGSTRHRSSATFGDVVCVKEVDASTPKLQEAIADGTCFPKVNIDLTTSSEGGKRIPYLLWELKQARVSSYSVSGATDGSMVPTEQISLNFEEIKVTYDKLGKDNKSGGKVEYTWKIEEGVK
jgi:type VI secretion system secreted protein Hcp